jgi:hypothetical protein
MFQIVHPSSARNRTSRKAHPSSSASTSEAKTRAPSIDEFCACGRLDDGKTRSGHIRAASQVGLCQTILIAEKQAAFERTIMQEVRICCHGVLQHIAGSFFARSKAAITDQDIG